MNARLPALALAAVAAALALDSHAAAQVAQCPDERASNVPVDFGASSTTDTCREYVVILGFRITQNASTCPTWTSMHPAHQVCSGVAHAGTKCAFEQTLSVETRTCECRADGTTFFGSVVENCECSEPTESGTVEDYETVACAGVVPPGT